MARWFRFYDDALNDPKVQCLPPALFKTWVNILCVASKNDGALPDAATLAFLLRQDAAALSADMKALESAGLLDATENGLQPHNWSGRQFKSDDSGERVKKLRKRAAARDGNGGEAVTPAVTCNDETDVTVTPSESDTEQNQIQNRTDQREAVAVAPPAERKAEEPFLEIPEGLKRTARATRLPPDWQPSEGLKAWAAERVPRLDWKWETEQFRDWWLAKAGQGGTKLDWDATWRKWMRTAAGRLPQQYRTTAEPPPDDGRWVQRVEGFQRTQTWLPAWGPKPGEAGCQAPADVLRRHGFARAA